MTAARDLPSMQAVGRGDATRRSRILWIVGADCGVAALAFALVLTGDQRLPIVVSFIGLAVLLPLIDVGLRLAAAAHSGALARFARTGGIVAAVLALLALMSRVVGAEVALLFACVFAGMALIAQWLVGVVERSGTADDPTPWQVMADAAPSPSAPPPLSPAWRATGAVIGAALLVFVTFDVIAYGQVQDALGLYGVGGHLLGLVALAGLVLLLAGPLLLSAQAGARRARQLRERAAERQAVAAHLHDSVLQTLALIQRSAADPERVAQLARRQERGLRSWLAGRDELQATSLAVALEAVVAEVEDESGVAIECVLAGDLPVDERTGPLAQAARETLRNAVRHGRTGVRLVLDVDASGASIFVRDTGAGFDPTSVPEERRGVRDAIIGRMQVIGGTTTIDSGPGGTEVVLHLPAEGGRA